MKERRKSNDRRRDDRRADERRRSGIGEVMPERRKGPRRLTDVEPEAAAGDRRTGLDRRETPEEWAERLRRQEEEAERLRRQQDATTPPAEDGQ